MSCVVSLATPEIPCRTQREGPAAHWKRFLGLAERAEEGLRLLGLEGRGVCETRGPGTIVFVYWVFQERRIPIDLEN